MQQRFIYVMLVYIDHLILILIQFMVKVMHYFLSNVVFIT